MWLRVMCRCRHTYRQVWWGEWCPDRGQICCRCCCFRSRLTKRVCCYLDVLPDVWLFWWCLLYPDVSAMFTDTRKKERWARDETTQNCLTVCEWREKRPLLRLSFFVFLTTTKNGHKRREERREKMRGPQREENNTRRRRRSTTLKYGKKKDFLVMVSRWRERRGPPKTPLSSCFSLCVALWLC